MLQKLQKSKIFISLLVAVVLVFSYNHTKPKAIVPLAWAGYVLAGLAADQLITMGVKAVSKQVLKKKADDFAAKALKEGKYDFMGTNPYRNKDGSISLSPTANDRAKMAALISGALIGSMAAGGEGGACVDPLGETVQITGEGSEYFALIPYIDSRGRTSAKWISRISPEFVFAKYEPTDAKSYSGSVSKNADGTYRLTTLITTLTGQVVPLYVENVNSGFGVYPQSVGVAESVGAEIISCDGLYIPSTIDRVYPYNPAVQPPNSKDLTNIPITIYNVMPPGPSGPMTWGEIENSYQVEGKDFSAVMGSNIDTYLAKGTISNNLYTIGEINNLYTDINNPVKIEDLVPPDDLPVPIPGGEIEPVAPINRGMLQVMKESYQFLADGIDNSIQSMKTVTDKSMGLINYLDTAFRWLPAEWRAMFGAAFVLGVFAHFFRR